MIIIPLSGGILEDFNLTFSYIFSIYYCILNMHNIKLTFLITIFKCTIRS